MIKSVTQQEANFLEANLEWLAKVSPHMLELVSQKTSICEFKSPPDGDQIDLYFDNQLVLESCKENLDLIITQQLKKTDGVAMPRAVRSKNFTASSSPSEILSKMVDVHYEVLLEHLPSLDVEGDPNSVPRISYKNLVVFGSLMLCPLLDHLLQNKDSSWISITLVEDDPRQLRAALSLMDFPTFVDVCRQRSIGLTLHVDTNKSAIQDRLYTQVGQDNPTLLFGWQTLRSPVLSPGLMEIHSWLHAPEGAAQHTSGLLGFSTDDINQTQQALWNALSSKQMKMIAPSCFDEDVPIVLAASGPSLNDQIPWLKEASPKLNLVAAGSSLGSLLRAGIRPSAAVFLERSAETYTDLCDILADGFSLDGISLLVSSTIDPRLPDLFDQVVFFHRPVAAATSLFPDDGASVLPVCGPHVVNAALEAVLALGCRELLLVGADFSAPSRLDLRASGALGVSPRDFNIPVRGNKGQTVFSESALIHTGYLLNRIIETTPNCEALRLGQGIILPAVNDVELTDQLIDRFSRAPGCLHSALLKSSISSFSREDCRELFDLVEEDIAEVMSTLRAAVSTSEGWSKSLAESISPYLQRFHEGDSRPRRMLSQLLCYPLFFGSMLLYDNPSDSSDKFNDSKAKFLGTLDLLESVVLQWLRVMKPWLVAPRLPTWDPEWLRKRYGRIASNQA